MRGLETQAFIEPVRILARLVGRQLNEPCARRPRPLDGERDKPLAEPESAPQIAVEATPETASAEAAPAPEPAPTPMAAEVAPETAGATPPPAEPPAVEEKPAKAVAAG